MDADLTRGDYVREWPAFQTSHKTSPRIILNLPRGVKA